MNPSHSRGRASTKRLAVILLLIAVPFGGVGYWFARTSWSFTSVAVRADGKVIRMMGNPGQGKHRGMAPVVEFHVDGTRHEFQSWLFVSPPQYSVDDKVTVLFSPHDPKNASIDSFTDLWLFPVIFGGVGGVLAIVACVILAVSCWPRTPTLKSDSANFLD